MGKLTLTVEYQFNTEADREAFFQKEISPRLCFRGGNVETYSTVNVFDKLQELEMKASNNE